MLPQPAEDVQTGRGVSEEMNLDDVISTGNAVFDTPAGIAYLVPVAVRTSVCTATHEVSYKYQKWPTRYQTHRLLIFVSRMF